MSFEKPQFNNPEDKPESSIEGRKMSKAESEKMLGEMDEYIGGLETLLHETEVNLKNFDTSPELVTTKIAQSLLAHIEKMKKQSETLSGKKQQDILACIQRCTEDYEKFNDDPAEWLRTEIKNIQEQISGLGEYSEEGKEEGAEFFEK